MAKNVLVVKSNNLIEASYRLTLDEMRVLLLTIGEIDPFASNHHRDFEFSVADFAERFGVSEKIAYQQVQNAVDKLGGRWAVIESTPTVERKVTFLTEQAYFKGEGRFQIVLHEKLMPFVSEIRGKFTKYNLECIAKFNSFHSIRIYEVLAQYKKQGWRKVSVSDLKEWLQVSDKYERWDNFKNRVLTPAVTEINEKSDLFITVEPIKRGRKITALHFDISVKNNDKSEQSQIVNDERTRKIHGVFDEIQRPQVLKGSQAEYDWARDNYSRAVKQMRELGIVKGRFIESELSQIPTDWLKVLKKYASITDRYFSREIADELYKRKEL